MYFFIVEKIDSPDQELIRKILEKPKELERQREAEEKLSLEAKVWKEYL